ncbi:MAG: deoxyribonuclease IV [Dehalococcoidia bacterium]
MLIGAHVSTAGGVQKSVARAEEIGAECIQVFASSPRAWAFKPITDEAAESFRSEIERAGMGATVLHAIYLVALGAADEALYERSVDSLGLHLRAAGQLGALGLIFHPASHRGQGFDGVFDQFVTGVQRVLDCAPGDALLMLETSAGSGDHIGSKFSDLGRIIKAVDSPRLAVCLDTQHVWAAGYDVVDSDGLNAAMDEFDREIGLDRLAAVHANDSMKSKGAAVDRHDNIGDGLIGKEGFLNVMRHPAFKNVPFYLEVPGADKKGPDKPNVDALKAIRTEAGVTA